MGRKSIIEKERANLVHCISGKQVSTMQCQVSLYPALSLKIQRRERKRKSDSVYGLRKSPIKGCLEARTLKTMDVGVKTEHCAGGCSWEETALFIWKTN